jgi:hypothetical protein
MQCSKFGSFFAPELALGAPGRRIVKYRALAGLTHYRHVAAHYERELTGDGKSEVSGAILLSRRSLCLGELLEQLAELLRGPADAGIGNRKSK